MRRLLSRGVWMTALVAAVGLAATPAGAQRPKKRPAAAPPPPPVAAAKPPPVDLDADNPPAAPAAATPKSSKAVVDNSPPPQAGQMTRGGRASEAPLRRREVVRTRRWRSTASTTGETGDDEGNKQIAQYPPRDRALPPEVLPGGVRHLQRDRRQAEPPQVQRDAALAREARDRLARAGRHHRARRQVQRRAGRAVQQPRTAAISTGS